MRESLSYTQEQKILLCQQRKWGEGRLFCLKSGAEGCPFCLYRRRGERPFCFHNGRAADPFCRFCLHNGRAAGPLPPPRGTDGAPVHLIRSSNRRSFFSRRLRIRKKTSSIDEQKVSGRLFWQGISQKVPSLHRSKKFYLCPHFFDFSWF